MAGTKKKKKPVANPARGFATTSIAAKPRPENTNVTPNPDPVESHAGKEADTQSDGRTGATEREKKDTPLSAEEFEKNLEESELQLLVEKYAQKVKRDAQRQQSRLETDRRLLRNQADAINTSKWFPTELLDQVIELIKAESRFSASNVSNENSGSGRMPSEEDAASRLWTLQQTLLSIGFSENRVQTVIKYILDISPQVSNSVKDSIWGLEEALDWLARECDLDELPSYEFKPKPLARETPNDTPIASRAATPRPSERSTNSVEREGNISGHKNKITPSYKTEDSADESDIEPDDLIPQYIASKSRLLELTRLMKDSKKQGDIDLDIEKSKLQFKIRKIESDVLFEREVADQQWRLKKVTLEKEFAASRNAERMERAPNQEMPEDKPEAVNMEGDINDEAERIAAEILQQEDDDDPGLTDLFASLPQSEIDPSTGKSQTFTTDSSGVKLIIRDFGKWVGVSPRRVFEEACRSRDSNAKFEFRVVSASPFANRHAVKISWTKPQQALNVPEHPDLDIVTDSTQFSFAMNRIATPDLKQSEAFVATVALFHVFSRNAREEKVYLKLPPVWRDLWFELVEERKTETDAKDRDILRELRDLVRQRQDQELEDGVILQGAFRSRNGTKNATDMAESAFTSRPKVPQLSTDMLRKIWVDKQSTAKYQHMLKSRMQLPMWNFKSQVLEAVNQNQVVIVCGETGCGKSTQVPAFLLETELSNGKPCKIYCTEPRRISAISLARRVSEELGENRGDLGTSRSLVGYSIRLEANTSKETRLIYATTGIVMRMLESSTDLQEVTHLVLDEVHERSIDSDFLLIVLKRLMRQRKDLKVVLMSATVDAERFSSYLDGAPILNVPGRTFPVDVRYLEDAIELTGYVPSGSINEKMVDLDDDVDVDTDNNKNGTTHQLIGYSQKTRNTILQIDEYQIDFDLIVQLIFHISFSAEFISYSNAILVFLPGIAEIRTLNDLLLGDPRFAKSWLVYPLHSTIATEDQEAAFLIPPQGMRKIVLATNIAETGITIPDVTCVIDTGKHKEMRFDERRQLSRLLDAFISRANAKQRRGRAGRVQNGLCFHLFTKLRHDTIMSDQQTPEMLRLSLQDLAIRVKICKIGGIDETLSSALDPPSSKNIRRAIDALIDVRALTSTEELTPLGRQLARLPLDVFLGKLVLLGTIFKCLDMAITLAAMLSSKSPFSAPFGQRTQADNARAAFRRGDSDLLTVYNAYTAWKRVCTSNSGMGKELQFCRRNFLSQQTLANIEDLKGQLLVSLADSGFLLLTDDERRNLSRSRSGSSRGRRHQSFYDVPSRVNINSDNDVVSASVIAWSFYPKLLVRDIAGSKGVRNIGNNQSISIHPSSVNRTHLDLRWLSYYHIMQSKSVYRAHETTAVDPFAIALLCGDVRCDVFSGVIVLDGNRARFSVPDWKTMLVIKILRTRIRELLNRSFKQPGKLPTAQHEKWLDIWQRLFTQDFNQDKSIGVIGKSS